MLKSSTEHSLGTVVNSEAETDQAKAKVTQNLNTQVKVVKQKTSRRKFKKPEKLKILTAFDACQNASERGALLRKEGLYYASITKWRLHLSEGASSHGNSKAHKLMLAHNQVTRENMALKKKLALAETVIELQKKISELLSMNILSPEMSEE